MTSCGLQSGDTAGKVHTVQHWTSPPAAALLCLPQGSSSFSNDWSREFYQVSLRIHMHAALGGAQFSSVQSLSRVWLFATPRTTARQASLSITNSRSPTKLMSMEPVIPSHHFILCHPSLLLPSIFPSIRVFSNESALPIRWPKHWSFSFNISPSNEHPTLISPRMDWLDLLAVQGTVKSLLQHHSSKVSILQSLGFFMVQLSTSIHDYWKNHSFDQMDLWQQSNVSAF